MGRYGIKHTRRVHRAVNSEIGWFESSYPSSQLAWVEGNLMSMPTNQGEIMCDCDIETCQCVADDRASYWRNRDEIVGYPAYTGGPQ